MTNRRSDHEVEESINKAMDRVQAQSEVTDNAQTSTGKVDGSSVQKKKDESAKKPKLLLEKTSGGYVPVGMKPSEPRRSKSRNIDIVFLRMLI